MNFDDLFGSPEPGIFQLGESPRVASIATSRTKSPSDSGVNFPPDDGSQSIPSLADSPKPSIPRLVDIVIELPSISLKRKLEYATVEDVDDDDDVDEVSFLPFCIITVYFMFSIWRQPANAVLEGDMIYEGLL